MFWWVEASLSFPYSSRKFPLFPHLKNRLKIPILLHSEKLHTSRKLLRTQQLRKKRRKLLRRGRTRRSEEHTSELQSRQYLVCRLLLEKKKHYSISAPSSNPK